MNLRIPQQNRKCDVVTVISGKAPWASAGRRRRVAISLDG